MVKGFGDDEVVYRSCVYESEVEVDRNYRNVSHAINMVKGFGDDEVV